MSYERLLSRDERDVCIKTLRPESLQIWSKMTHVELFFVLGPLISGYCLSVMFQGLPISFGPTAFLDHMLRREDISQFDVESITAAVI